MTKHWVRYAILLLAICLAVLVVLSRGPSGPLRGNADIYRVTVRTMDGTVLMETDSIGLPDHHVHRDGSHFLRWMDADGIHEARYPFMTWIEYDSLAQY